MSFAATLKVGMPIVRSLYRALGVSPSADEAQIKAAFRQLAKRSHPDLNAGDTESGERFKAIHQAYRLLRNPQTRAVLDLISVRARAASRRRGLATAATMAATFILTVGGGVLFLTWPPHAERQVGEQQAPSGIKAKGLGENPTSDTPADAAAVKQVERPPAPVLDKASTEGRPQQPPLQEVPLTHSAKEEEKPPSTPAPLPVGDKAANWTPALVKATPIGSRRAEWNTYQNVRFGFSLKYPAHVFAADTNEGDSGVLFVSHDGRARLRISATRAGRVTTLPIYRRKLMDEQYGGAAFDRTPLHRTWFALSGKRGDLAFYERVACSCDGKALHAWQLTYPPAERAFYEPIIDEIRRSYRRQGEDGERHCRRGQT